jgi:uncharacterized protein
MSMPSAAPTRVSVRALHVYPLKSAQGLALDSVRLNSTGFEWDRRWMAVDQQGKFLSQRTHPPLARVETRLTADALWLRSPELQPLALPLTREGSPIEVQVWKDYCSGIDQGPAASEWISTLLGESARLVRAPEAPRRLADSTYAGPDPPPLTYADGFQILVCNAASLDDLNARMPQPIPMERFRPNIVLQGLAPFAEDHIEQIQAGQIVLRLVKPCTRCVITSTDQRTGERSTNPLPVLRRFRFDRRLMGVTFGENAIPVSGIGHEIRVGSSCELRYRQNPA